MPGGEVASTGRGELMPAKRKAQAATVAVTTTQPQASITHERYGYCWTARLELRDPAETFEAAKLVARKIADRWDTICSQVYKRSHRVSALLKLCAPVQVEDFAGTQPP